MDTGSLKFFLQRTSVQILFFLITKLLDYVNTNLKTKFIYKTIHAKILTLKTICSQKLYMNIGKATNYTIIWIILKTITCKLHVLKWNKYNWYSFMCIIAKVSKNNFIFVYSIFFPWKKTDFFLGWIDKMIAECQMVNV